MKHSPVIIVLLCSLLSASICYGNTIKVVEKKVNWVEDIVDQPMFARSICDGESY